MYHLTPLQYLHLAMDKTTCYYIFAYAILVITCRTPCLAKTYTNLTTDQSTLATLKSHFTLDSYHILTKNWTNSTSICSWIGVTCGLRHRRVTALNISNMSLAGTIPPQIGNLTFLVSLDLGYNFFRGTLPPESSFLHRLKFISLDVNKFEGEIPPSLGHLPKLEHLFLRNNSFTGAIPSAIFNISTLRTMHLKYNELSGSLPPDICHNLPFLEEIGLSYNQLSGEIPSNLSQCQQLKYVTLSYNMFSGEIPPEIGKLTSVQYLALGGNKWTGGIPKEICNLQNMVRLGIEWSNISGTLPLNIFNLSSLRFLGLGRNNLRGNLPKDFANLTRLTTVYLVDNNFTGVLPINVAQLHHLEILHLGNNHFTGSILPELFNISTLLMLSLGKNSLSGGLPTNFCYGSPLLQELYLNWNDISGEIPSSITNCALLSHLALESNRLTGVVPHFLSNLTLLEVLHLGSNNLRIESSSSELSFITSLTTCRSLKNVAISDNPLDGIIPSSIGNFSSSLQYFFAYNCIIKGGIPIHVGNLSNLIMLSLFDNELSGTIPHTFKHLHNIQALILDYNHLRDSIPEHLCSLPKISYIYFGHNQLSGTIPECLGNLISLRELSLESNKLASTIPSSLWHLTDLLMIDLSENSLGGILSPEIGNLKVAIYINLSVNQLSESIPSAIGNLQNLVNLSLEHNRLEGTIPESVGSMISLITLDLSYNNLSGPIPKSFEKLKQLEYFNVSFNALSGEIPTSGPFRNFTMESFKANKALCGIQRFNVPLCRNVTNHKSDRKKVKLALFIIAGVVVLFGVISLTIIFIRRIRNKETGTTDDQVGFAMARRISYHDILHSTEQFNESNLLGVGSFGSVYRGILRDGMTIAVKVFNMQTEAALRSFDVECSVLRNIRHRNLTKVISSCSNEDFRALLLEYMPMGNLEKWLYSHNNCLDAMQRLAVMIDVACALEYLHHGYLTPIVHCDLKPSNVLFDEEMIAHVSDFGIAKLLGDGESIVLTNTLATLGYIAPEYGLEGLVSTRCDVYSYGIMLLETFTRKRPSDDMFGGDISLKSWVESLLPDSLDQVMDVNLLTDLDDEHCDKVMHCVFSVLVLALKCSTDSPVDRINMKEALFELQKIKRQFF